MGGGRSRWPLRILPVPVLGWRSQGVPLYVRGGEGWFGWVVVVETGVGGQCVVQVLSFIHRRMTAIHRIEIKIGISPILNRRK